VVFVGGEGGGAVTGMGRQLRGALLVSPFVKQRFVLFLARERAEDYERLTHLIESGQLAPRLDRSYRLEQAADAVRLLEHGEIRGKVAVTV
jgi:NADPH:quinone reductase-like Zn-dependent oxidoreductase